jgi:Domain of unknown function (DUF3854)
VNPHLAFLLSSVYDGALAPAHREDLEQSGLSTEFIRAQFIRSIPPDLIDRLLGFDVPAVRSAYLIPFPDPRGGWMDHVRMKVFPPLTTEHGTIKYLQPKRSGVRIYFPLASLEAVLQSDAPLFVVEGEKKALAVALLGLTAIGLCGIEGWHLGGSRALHPHLDAVPLQGRDLTLVPDADWTTILPVNRAVQALAAALARRGGRPSILNLAEVAA